MSTPCTNCNGVGLVSTGADPKDLSVGSKVTCTACQGTGAEAGTQPEAAPEAPVSPEEQGDVSPKVPDPAQDVPSGDGSSDSNEAPAPIEPQEGAACLTADGTPGVLAKDENGNWVCSIA